ncbi:anhydro-N-acetylmuramic acid kinase [Chitinophaga sp. SYP-B3965]|uniref:anhydro-N-acetylmuramic acid kinase n=1 Tax=Chitinophaga sp. SYP-B3965 TaxID=2663120 RepID=UPI001299AD95|nr:anhydro-N-acetylmuramic acid kinase [Chitinophaga sp. SYP-B3965]MRG44047.1 anhydro-N-acetylmuramic acid kinase [Chitinophaga sp. SYP-B3965]
MNTNISRLYEISRKAERLVIGLMSGTSVDGLDVALCRFSGTGMEAGIELLAFETLPYEEDYKTEISSIFSKRNVDLEKVCLLNGWIAQKHAEMILQCLQKWGKTAAEIDLVASHGQSIFHAPKSLHKQAKFGNATLQIGDGDHLAVETGIITLSDFRQKHVAAGGEGAPLAAYGDYLIFSKKGENRIMLNIGGIANFTYLPGDLNADEVFCSDTGPGNTLMDAFIQKHYPGKYFDENSAVASKGVIQPHLLKALKNHPFFQQPFPKTTGPELFNLAYLDNTGISNEDTMATLNRFSAETITEAIKAVTKDGSGFHFYVSGGGMHNPLLMKNIAELLPGCTFKSTKELHINPDAKEAVLFAVLANEAVCGGTVNFGKGRNGIPNVSMGKVSFPW